MKIFFDTEFTGLHKNTTLISIGLITEYGDMFYGEFTDYDKSQITPWIQENVINNTLLERGGFPEYYYVGDTAFIKKELIGWFNTQYVEAIQREGKDACIQMWSDCLAYDWVLFTELYADYTSGYPVFHYGVSYIPMDISTLFYIKGIDPDISREEFARAHALDYGLIVELPYKHNALYDALMINVCYENLRIIENTNMM